MRLQSRFTYVLVIFIGLLIGLLLSLKMLPKAFSYSFTSPSVLDYGYVAGVFTHKETGKPINNVRITINSTFYAVPVDQQLSAEQWTDDAGQFRFKVPVGFYWLSFDYPNTPSSSFYLAEDAIFSATVTSGATVTRNFSLNDAYGSIAVHDIDDKTGQSIPCNRVDEFGNLIGYSHASVYQKQRGEFVSVKDIFCNITERLPVGIYYVRGDVPNLDSAQRKYSGQFYDRVLTTDQAKPITITANQTTTLFLRFQPAAYGHLQAKLLDKITRQPIVGMRMLLKSRVSNTLVVEASNAQGVISTTLDIGEYDIYPLGEDLNNVETNYVLPNWGHLLKQSVVITSGHVTQAQLSYSPLEWAELTGRVVDRITGEIVENVNIVANEIADHFVFETSSVNGSYRLRLLAGDYHLQAVPYLPNEMRPRDDYDFIFYPQAKSREEAQVVTISANVPQNIDFKLPTFMGWLVGQVTDANTQLPLAGVRVSNNNTNTITNKDGFYRLPVRTGVHYIQFQAGAPYGNVEYGGSLITENGYPNPFIYIQREITTTLNVGLKRQAVLGFYLYDPVLHKPISGLNVNILNQPYCCATTKTDQNGYYTVTLPAGQYYISFDPIDSKDYSLQNVYFSPQTVVLGDGEVRTIEVNPLKNGILTGRVTALDTGRPISGATVTVYDGNYDFSALLSSDPYLSSSFYTETDANGRYELKLPPKAYWVKVDGGISLTNSVGQWLDQTTSSFGALPTRLEPSQTTTRDVQLISSGFLTASYRSDLVFTPPVLQKLHLYPVNPVENNNIVSPTFIGYIYVDQGATYSYMPYLANIAPGSYRAKIYYQRGAQTYPALSPANVPLLESINGYYPGVARYQDAQTIHVTSSQTTTLAMEVTQANLGRICGVVINQYSESQIVFGKVEAYNLDGEQSSMIMTNEKSQYCLWLFPGTYQIRYAGNSASNRFNDYDLPARHPKLVEVRAGETISNIMIQTPLPSVYLPLLIRTWSPPKP